MTFIYSILMFALLILFVLAIQRQLKYYHTITPVMGWLAGLFYFIALPLTFIILNGGYEKPGYPDVYGLWGKLTTQPSEFLAPFITIWITLSLTNLCVIFFTKKKTANLDETDQVHAEWIVSIPQLKRILLITIFISFVFFGINIVLGGGLSSYFSQHWYYRFNEYSEQFGIIFTLYLKVYSANQVILAAATGLLIVTALKKQWQNNYGLLALSLSTMILHMIMSGNRIYIALLLIYILLAMVSFLDAKKLIKFFLYFIPIVPIFSIWSYIRSNIANLSSALRNYVTTINQASSKIMTTLMDLTEGSNNILLVKIMHDFGSEYDFLRGATYLRGFTSILPDSLNLYVENFSIKLAKIYQPGIRSSMNSTALGEAWANFGYLVIPLIPIFTVLIMKIGDHLFNHREKQTLLTSVLLVILAWMARSVFAENFQVLVISFLIIWALRYEKNLLCLSDSN